MPVRSRIPATLVATRLSFDRGAATVLKDVSVTVAPASCVGVVGPNGVGKSTLLQILAGLHAPDAGTVRLDPPSATVGYLTQEHDHPPGETVRDALYRRTGVAGAEAELAAAGEALGAGAPGADERFALALERYDGLSAADLDARIAGTLDELGLPPGIAEQDAATLSGGQAARVALAAIVLSRFDITLLDEPTNDLDFDGLRRLEALVAQRSGAMVIVSHDRAFLDATVTSVLELDEHDHTARLFGGGWSAYLEERATARRHAEEAYAVNMSQRRELADRARRERQWATSAVRRERRDPRDHDKAQRDFRINRTEKLASRARQTERAIERLDPVDKPWQGWDLRFTIEQAPRAGAVVARLDGAVVERGDFRLGPVTLEIGWAERIGLVGPNGSGKTSLVDALLGRLPLAEGSAWLGPSVVVGELGQDRRPSSAADGGGTSILDIVIDRCGLTVPEARSLLAKFGLGPDHLSRPRALLSPGERPRAELAMFQAREVNFLVLDEPTNHLDLPAVEQIEEALSGFDGTVLLVSHDRRLLDAVDLTRRIDLGEEAATWSRGA
ncbi:MAG TPA: ABC-F family ATP-binding cassette domain-containing protein [Acidimicrobiales bacterium]|nr:ABC-F family ATP-binding cassette domain-containing protein [Acidimicrobiales bacterium]